MVILLPSDLLGMEAKAAWIEGCFLGCGADLQIKDVTVNLEN